MSTASQTYMVAAYFQEQSDAENAIRDLQKAGFRSDQIGTSFDDFDQEDWGDVTKRPSNQLTSDEYSPNSANASAAAHDESFWQKVKDFFSGETADSDINDHSVVNRAHQDITDRSWQSSGIRIPDTYDTRLTKGEGLVLVHSGDRSIEAETILARNHGEIERDFSAWTKDTAAGMGQGTRADITGGEVGTGIAATTKDIPSHAELAGDNMQLAALSTNPGTRNATPKRRIQLISEVLRVHKERLGRGDVRLPSEARTGNLPGNLDRKENQKVRDQDDPSRKIA